MIFFAKLIAFLGLVFLIGYLLGLDSETKPFGEDKSKVLDEWYPEVCSIVGTAALTVLVVIALIIVFSGLIE